MLLRLAIRELRRSWRFGVFFIFNLSLGLTGFVALQAFNSALQSQIDANAKAILSADLAISSRRQMTQAELTAVKNNLPAGTRQSQIYEFFAMLSSAKGSRLVMLKAVDANYPFYGDIKLDSGKIIQAGSNKDLQTQDVAWIYPELQAQLGLQVGDDIELGQLKLKISNVIKDDATQTFRMASLAPRVYIDLAKLPKSGLLQYGSTFSLANLLRLPDGTDAVALREKLFEALPDPQISIDTPSSAGEDSGRQLGYLADYLGLVALVALFMSALGAAYLYRLFISTRMKEIAILRSLGLQSYQAVGVYVLQAALLGLLATIPTLIFAQLILPFLSRLLASFTPFNLHPQVQGSAFVVALLMAVFGTFLICLPFLLKILDLKAAKLFSEGQFSEGQGRFRWWSFVPMILIFYALAVNQSHSWRTGSLFIGALLAVLLVLALCGFLVLKLAALLKTLKSWRLRFSFLSLSRRAGASLAIFVALGTGAMLINILPQLKSTLQGEFQFEGASRIPSLFMFDIQDEQLAPLQDKLKSRGLEVLETSPLVRARILKVNGQDYERKLENTGFKTREEEREARFRNRGLNLSYRPSLSQSEQIVEGKAFSGPFDSNKQKYAELSVEIRFAERMGFRVGDILLFDVQGVEVEGQVINLRKVNWATFRPNFFVLMQDGVLNEAPKTFISAIPSLKDEERQSLQNQLAKDFPNISIVDVVRTVNEVLETADKMSWSLELMAGLALLTGYIVLFSIVRSQIKLRRWELNMLKILGASGKDLAVFIVVEFAFLAFGAAAIGALLSIAVSFGLNLSLFESEFKLSLLQPFVSVLFITGFSVFISFLASLDIIRESALGILREER
jgi:putative ABC transport system permease protein